MSFISATLSCFCIIPLFPFDSFSFPLPSLFSLLPISFLISLSPIFMFRPLVADKMSLDDDDPACSGSENYTIHLPQRTNEGMVKVTVTRTKTLRRPKTLLSVNHVLLLTFLTACSFAQVTTAVHHAVQDVSVQGYSRSNGGATIVRFRFMCGGDKNLGGFVNKERELELGLAKHKELKSFYIFINKNQLLISSVRLIYTV